MLSLGLFRYSSDLFLSSRPTYRIGNRVYYWVWLRPDRLFNVKNTHTVHTHADRNSYSVRSCESGLWSARQGEKEDRVVIIQYF